MRKTVVNVSNKHIHLSKEHVEALFGKGYVLTRKKTLMQPFQFAANEVLTLVGPRNRIENVRIVAPERERTQVEITVGDARQLGVPAAVRLSGDLDDSAGIILEGPAGIVELKEGCIVAKRHIHFPLKDAQELNLKTGDMVSVKISGERSLVYENVVIRVDKNNAEIECHLDIEEANAALIKNGDMAEILL